MRVTEQTVRSGVSGDAVKQKVGFSDLVVHSVTRGQGGAGTANTMPTLVQGEPGEISILLSNPYSVPIQVDSIELMYVPILVLYPTKAMLTE